MSADDKDLGLEGLANLTSAAKKTAAKKVAAANREQQEETSETFQSPATAPTNAPAYSWSPEELAALREEIKAEVMAEVKAARFGAQQQNEQGLAAAIEYKKNPSSKDDPNPFTLPEGKVAKEDLPPLVHFVEDGFTINGAVTYRGQEYEPVPGDDWAVLSTQDQILRYGSIKFRRGPWEGLPFDLDDPNLTEEDRVTLEAVMRDRYAQRVKAPLSVE